MGTCHVDLGAAYLGAYPEAGAYHSTGQNSYLGACPGVGAYPGDYGNTKYMKLILNSLLLCGTPVLAATISIT